MNKALRLTIVSQEEQILDQEVDSVTLPTENGQITLLKDHQPIISKLTFGDLTYRVGKEEQKVVVTHGFVNKKHDNQVLVVVDVAFSARELNDAKVREAIEKAKETYRISQDRQELLMMESSLKQLFWELQIANKKKQNGHP